MACYSSLICEPTQLWESSHGFFNEDLILASVFFSLLSGAAAKALRSCFSSLLYQDGWSRAPAHSELHFSAIWGL
jgi:hypothetical protein